MLSFLSPQKHVDAALLPTVDIAVEPAHADDAEERVSSASVPTIDSAPTIQGQPAASQPHPNPLPDSPNPAASLVPPSSVHAQASAPSVHTQSSSQTDRPVQSQSQSALPYSSPATNSSGRDPRRFSFPSFSFLRSDSKQNKARTVSPPLKIQPTSTSKVSEKRPKAGRTFSLLIVGSATSSDRRAKESAAIARSVIIGNHNAPPDSRLSRTKPPSRSDVARVKTQLLQPKTAAKVITHLRTLPAHPNDTVSNINLPIHAVCLSMPDSEVLEQHFAQLQSVATASIPAVSTALADLHLIDLVTAPNMGFGAPVTAQGLFAGAVPTAETIIDGIEQITPQLMALGYATGKAIFPDHKGIVVPADRLSVLTCQVYSICPLSNILTCLQTTDWWGFEICLPPPTIAHLAAAESPGSALLNLLTAISILNEGVREIIPFIRYIAQFVQSEWSLIKRADEGKGVVCTATWLLPIALVPRAWDFPDPPPPHTELAAAGQTTPTSPSVKRFSATLTTPKPSTEVPNGAPRSSSAYSSETRDDEESRPVISSDPPVLPELVVSSPGSIDGAPSENVDGKGHNAYNKVQHDGEPTAH